MVKADKILLDHGGGGKLSHLLITDLLLPFYDNPILSKLHDGAVLDINGQRMAFSCDSFVVDPVFFPGGSIGDLAVNGTVNDLSMCGAIPQYLSLGLILEEGFSIRDLQRVLKDVANAAGNAGVLVATGDTKVVPKGAVDKIFIHTSGIGQVPEGIDISSDRARPGDKVILSGSIADHGMTIMAQREGMSFDSPAQSDTAPLNHMVARMLAVCNDIHVLRDPTRGGIGTALNEIAGKSDVGVKIYEEKIPLKDEVAGICEILGFDPLYVANEGKLIAFVPPNHAEQVLEAIREDTFGESACIIGEAIAEYSGKVIMQTRIGGTRIVDMLTGEQLPRIC
jgi:hydrogenase expression/formation protein HypE